MAVLLPFSHDDAAQVCGWVTSASDVVMFGGARLPWPLTASALLRRYQRLGFVDSGERTWAVVGRERWESVQMARTLW